MIKESYYYYYYYYYFIETVERIGLVFGMAGTSFHLSYMYIRCIIFCQVPSKTRVLPSRILLQTLDLESPQHIDH